MRCKLAHILEGVLQMLHVRKDPVDEVKDRRKCGKRNERCLERECKNSRNVDDADRRHKLCRERVQDADAHSELPDSPKEAVATLDRRRLHAECFDGLQSPDMLRDMVQGVAVRNSPLTRYRMDSVHERTKSYDNEPS